MSYTSVKFCVIHEYGKRRSLELIQNLPLIIQLRYIKIRFKHDNMAIENNIMFEQKLLKRNNVLLRIVGI